TGFVLPQDPAPTPSRFGGEMRAPSALDPSIRRPADQAAGDLRLGRRDTDPTVRTPFGSR
ncbi:MAG: hypothetical protein ACRCU5_02760, partial [Rhizobiaceae bacterium]